MSESNGFADTSDVLSMTKARRYSNVEVQGKKFCLASWTAREMEKYNTENSKKENRGTGNERLIVKTCVDPVTKDQLFKDTDIDDLRDLDARFVVALTSACMAHIGLQDETEEPEKN